MQAKVKKRAEEMSTASGALKHSQDGLVAAQADYDALPPVTTNPHEPQTDLERLHGPGRRPEAGEVRRGARRA